MTEKTVIPACYQITLTSNERRAIDWVGGRYSNGNDLRKILWADYKGSIEWEDDCDITFDVPEYAAWEIGWNAAGEDGDNEYNWPCFDGQLAEKLTLFCLDII